MLDQKQKTELSVSQGSNSFHAGEALIRQLTRQKIALKISAVTDLMPADVHGTPIYKTMEPCSVFAIDSMRNLPRNCHAQPRGLSRSHT